MMRVTREAFLYLSAREGSSSSPWLRNANRVVVAVGLAFSTSALVMRIYTKARIMKKFWWDDVLIIMAWSSSVAVQTTILYSFAHLGFGVHINNLSPSLLDQCLKSIIGVSVTYLFTLAFAKLGLLMLYYRILHVVRMWEYAIYILAFIVVGYTLGLALAVIFACSPIQKSWDVTITHGSCINRPILYLMTTVTNTASDLVLLLVPLHIVWGLRLPLIQKIGVALLLGLGSLALATSILRLATIWPLVHSPDLPYKIALASLFVNIEANFMIICASLPYLRQFIRHYFPRFFSRDIEKNLQSPSPRYTPTRKMQTPRMTTASEDVDVEMNGNETNGVESARTAEDGDDAASHLADTREPQR